MRIETSELNQLLEMIEEKNLSVVEVIELIKAHDGTNIEEQRIEAQLSEEQLTEAQRLEMGEEVNLVVDYTKTVEEMMELAGLNCPEVNSKNFPIPKELIGKKVSIKVKLKHYGREISSDDAIAEINKEGFREGIIFELLALAIKFPDLQRKFIVVALGAVGHNASEHRHVPVLFVYVRERKLFLFWFDYAWGGCYHFLAVRK